MGVTVRGVDELKQSLREAGSELEQMRTAHGRVSQIIAAAARPPRKTGRLAGSIRPDPQPDRASVVAGVDYAGMVEYGTRFMHPRPYLRPAVESTQPRWLDVYATEVQDICDRVHT